jgi:import inner membrane translocase subunit TIM17
LQGLWQNPKGQGRLKSTFLYVTRKAPRTAIAFSVWGGSFSCFDCLLSKLRRKEDVWNPIMAGTLVGFLLPMRRGTRPMLMGAVGGFVILSAIEGLQMWFQNQVVQDQSKMAPVGLPPGASYQQ